MIRKLLLLSAVALVPISAFAQMSCTDLGTWLAGQQYVLQVSPTTPFTTLTATGTNARCEANFVYSSRGGTSAGYADGQNQRIVLRVGLPKNSIDGGSGGVQGAWNGKVQNLGGGGLVGSVGSVTAATSTGYVGSSTDSGHTGAENPNFAVIQTTHTLNYGKLDDFLVESLTQQYQWALRIAKTYYGMAHTRNYWNGCSTGGRQGLSLALHHGEDFDGFLVGAPANFNSRLQMMTLWPWWVNKDVANNSVTSAMFASANAAAIKACDAMDGVVDGMMSDPRKCTYSAAANRCGVPGAPAAPDCLAITAEQAQAIDMMWDGSRNDKGTRIWFPFERGANAAVSSTATCGNLGSLCWAHRDTGFDWHPLPLSDFDDETELSTRVVAPYSDIMSTALQAAHARGAKIIMYHGGADPLIPHRQSIHYYNEAMDTFGGLDNLTPWFRFFVAPGMGHCQGGVGPQPTAFLFPALVDWVENGHAPDSIQSTNTSGGVVTRSRPMCPWPQTAIYDGGDPNKAESFHCGGNVETKATECLALIAKYQKETSNAYDTDARRNPATCNPNSNVPLDKNLGSAAVAPSIAADAVAERRVDDNGNPVGDDQ